MLRHEHGAEPVVVVSIAIVVIEREHATISLGIIVIAPTYEDWIARIDKVRVVQFNP